MISRVAKQTHTCKFKPLPLKEKNKKHSKILKNRDACCVECDKVVESI